MKGLSKLKVAMLIYLGCPLVMIHCCDYCLQQMGDAYVQDLDLFECFSGQSRLSAAFGRSGMSVKNFDICNDAMQDLSTPTGFLLALKQTLRLKPGSLLFGGIPCSSWVWISSSTSKRSLDNVMGDESKAFVRMGNLLSCRFALLVLVALVSGCMWMVEQPGTSLLRHAPYYIHLLTNCGPCFYKRTWMGLYGAKSCKATQLFGSAPMIMDFESHLPKPKRDELKLSSKGMVKRTICKGNPEKVWVTGDVGLRSSQAYPKKFAKTMVKFFNSQDASVAGLMPKMFEKMQHMYPKAFDGHGLWDYAALDSLKTFLKAEQHAGRFKPQGGLPYDD